MLPRLSLNLASPWGQSFKSIFDQSSDDTSNEELTSNPGSPHHHESSPIDTPPQSNSRANIDLIPDFQPHLIPPLSEFPLLAQDSRLHDTQSFTNHDSAPLYSQGRPAIPTTNYTLENALIHALPLPTFTPPPFLPEPVRERRNREPLQHEEWHALNTTPTVSIACIDTNRQDLPVRNESPPPCCASQQADASHIHPALRATYRPEDANNPDPPPPYYASEARRAHRAPRAVARPRHGRYNVVRDDPLSTAHTVRRVRHEGARVAMKTIGMSLVNCFAGVGKMTREVPRMGREMQQQNRVKRARGKIAWLEKYDFMSAQDRLLTQELGRG